ncbi:MAG TPA: T9SS type A sorting domain-containing protein, partial [Bacteroidia bacterium]|nr:T9SS type A sorting domain-containing protein [Bacteroidia bacterium]
KIRYTTVLPIEMLRFDGVCDKGNVLLNWTTASEQNNDFFTIERSTDGLTFSQIGTVDGAGNSDQILHYSFFDTDPVGGTNYYRIKQTDFNGAFSYNKIIAVSTADCDTKNFSVTNVLFSSTDLEIDYIHGKAPVTIEVYSTDGKLIKQIGQLPPESNYHLETADWSSSIYFIRVSDGISSITKTVQK